MEVATFKVSAVPQLEQLRQDLLTDAVGFYTRLLDLDPAAAQVYVKRAAQYGELGKFDLARRDYERAIELDPNNGEAYIGLDNSSSGSPILAAGYPPGIGLTYLKRGAELRPMDPDPHVHLGWNYMGSGQQKEAVAEFRKAAELSEPNSGMAYFMQAEVAFGLSDGRVAMANLEEMSRDGPVRPVAPSVGGNYFKIGDAQTPGGRSPGYGGLPEGSVAPQS